MIARAQLLHIREHDSALDIAEYRCKCPEQNENDLNKCSFAKTMTLSASVICLIARIDSVVLFEEVHFSMLQRKHATAITPTIRRKTPK